MIFTPNNAKKVLAGQKTQTRRLIKKDENAWETMTSHNITEVVQFSPGYPGGRVKYKVSKTYAVQPGRGKPAMGRIKITRIWAERLWAILTTDIWAEGFEQPSTGKITEREWYSQLWNSLHTKKGTRWEDNPEVWVIEFELVDSPAK